MRHVDKTALLASATIIRKGDDDDPVSVVTKSLEDLQKAVDDRLKAVEKKTSEPDKTIVDRLDDLETKLARPNIQTSDGEPTPERKAFVGYLRQGREILTVDEVKALRVADDTAGGYLAPDEFVA